jgi:hypothetical protein
MVFNSNFLFCVITDLFSTLLIHASFSSAQYLVLHPTSEYLIRRRHKASTQLTSLSLPTISAYFNCTLFPRTLDNPSMTILLINPILLLNEDWSTLAWIQTHWLQFFSHYLVSIDFKFWACTLSSFRNQLLTIRHASMINNVFRCKQLLMTQRTLELIPIVTIYLPTLIIAHLSLYIFEISSTHFQLCTKHIIAISILLVRTIPMDILTSWSTQWWIWWLVLT